mmetsp:Transcript_26820/g.42111  ORF Transcript_26820/g.42111 Transcript_26820/m.42111 type:complete len:232 (+) Transcript_26820:954-1649(+)
MPRVLHSKLHELLLAGAHHGRVRALPGHTPLARPGLAEEGAPAPQPRAGPRHRHLLSLPAHVAQPLLVLEPVDGALQGGDVGLDLLAAGDEGLDGGGPPGELRRCEHRPQVRRDRVEPAGVDDQHPALQGPPVVEHAAALDELGLPRDVHVVAPGRDAGGHHRLAPEAEGPSGVDQHPRAPAQPLQCRGVGAVRHQNLSGAVSFGKRSSREQPIVEFPELVGISASYGPCN